MQGGAEFWVMIKAAGHQTVEAEMLRTNVFGLAAGATRTHRARDELNRAAASGAPPGAFGAANHTKRRENKVPEKINQIIR